MTRPALRDDGFPTRSDMSLMSPAELAITAAMAEVERAGGSLALTDAVNLLGRARDRVADHVEAGPASAEEYNARYLTSHRISGAGFDVTSHMPCPFCAAPDFIVHRVMETEAAIERGAICKACARGTRAIVDRSAAGVRFEFVQTAGPDQPEWFTPKLRRFVAAAGVAGAV